LSADALLQKIAVHVAAFVKGAPQHDELTVSVVVVDKDSGKTGRTSGGREGEIGKAAHILCTLS
jgi:hypothetical protein